MAILTDAGFKMIGKYLEHKAWVENYKPVFSNSGTFDARKEYTTADGRIFMNLPNGCGAAAATVRKLVRDGLADGQYSWTRGRRMIPTEAGLAAYHERLLQEKRELADQSA
jgi:hypothetical protein